MNNLPIKAAADDGRDLEPVRSKDAIATAPPQAEAAPKPALRIPLYQRIFAAAIQLALVVAVLFGGFTGYKMITDSAPKAERKNRERLARLVDVTPVAAVTQGPEIVVWGEVRAAQTLVVRPEISGTVTWVSPELTAGGRLLAGEPVARIDDRDLKLAVERAEAEIAGIEARIVIEQGQADLGRLELRRLSRNLTEAQRALILRRPQMAQLEAELTAARSSLVQAEIALARTDVIAPFNAVVLSESVAPGAMLPQNTEVARLVAADTFEVVLAVPTAALEWIDIADAPRVLIRQPGAWRDGTIREGRIVRTASTLSETGRMAELIVEVDDPLSLDPSNAAAPVLLLGSFVEATIAGRAIEDAVSLDRAYLRDGDTAWVLGEGGKLEIRKLDIAWRGPETVLVRSGLSQGDRVVTTHLSTVAPGMALRTREGVS